jgi:hypothetical protein
MANIIRDFYAREHNVMSPNYLTQEMAIVICNHVVCVDGFTMSVQASSYHYSSPRYFLPSGDYTHWEIMQMTGQDEPLFDAYKGDEVYPYVPTDIVNQVIIKHGGLAENTVQIIK